ncbi:MAG: class I SAM-dependent methyltransferase [Deltaproteobacteria bacterium]|nr:class I SAM-dependent methyltransferase [Deltaproteobacteria bacterium]
MEREKIYNLKYGMHLNRRWGHPLLRMRLVTRSILRALDPRAEEMILEIGCNSGHILSEVGKRCPRCTGIDINKDMIQRLHHQRILYMNATTLAFKHQTFHKVYAVHTLEHIPGIRQVFREVHRILKPQGLFVFSFPLELFRGQSAVKDSMVLYGHPFYARKIHVHRLSPGKIRRIISGLPFEVKDTSWDLAPFPQYLMRLKKIQATTREGT